jgi:tRNA pseudouridine32 synthase/23S rRNA pseudouridine746 synthase/23S rRNA pseudouridine1911/1915/1917 synthase
MTNATVGWSWAELKRSRALFQNDDVLVLDKPPGLSVTGERHDTDVVELAREAGERLMPVHRIDKVTSGLVLLARNTLAHGPLTRQFAARTATKAYLAVVRATGLPERFTVDLPLTVGRKNTVRVAGPRDRIAFDAGSATWRLPEDAVVTGKSVYPSVTHVHRLHEHGDTSLVLANPVSGRRHQIRVHLAWTGAPILGDPLFAATSGHTGSDRTYLHSWRLALDTAWAGGRAEYTAEPGPDFAAVTGVEAGALAEPVWERLRAA